MTLSTLIRILVINSFLISNLPISVFAANNLPIGGAFTSGNGTITQYLSGQSIWKRF